MKIAIICFNLSWQSGGPRLIFSLAGALKKNNHQVVIYTPEFSGRYFRELWEGLDIRVVKPKREFIWSGRPKNVFVWIASRLQREFLKKDTAKRIARAMDGDFDVLNVHDFAYPTAYFYKKINTQVKVLWTENDPPYMYLPKGNFLSDILSRFYNRFQDIASRKYFKAIDKVLVLDSYNQKWCKKRGLNPVIIRPGIDFEKFYLPVKNFSSRTQSKRVRLFGLGSLNKYRRYEDIIRAVKYLRDWDYEASALIIANDQWNEKEYREGLLSLIKEGKLEEFIDINFKGVSEEGLRQVYQETDIFVYAVYLPPPRNGFGFSIGVFEAMAAGLPVVLCKTTTSTEVLEDNRTALFINQMSPEDIAKKVKFLIDNPEKYFSIASAGQNLIHKKLTWDKYTDSFLHLFKTEN